MAEIKKVQLDAALGIDATVGVKARIELYIHMYEIARKHKDLAKQVASNNIKDMKTEIEEAMISILFSYTCLEAYINIIGKDRMGDDWQKHEDSRSSTEGKWIAVSNALASKKAGKPTSIFSKTKEPFKSFLELKDIRNDYLIHRKAEFSDVVNTKYGRTEGIINVLNCDRAEWACKVVKDMIKKLCSNIENPPSIDWLD